MTPLGAEIRELRASRNLSLKDHAAIVGVTPAYLSALEHGHRGLPTTDMLERIASALQLDEAGRRRLELLADLSRPRVVLDTSGLEPVATELANRLAHGISRISKNDLHALLRFLQHSDPDHVGTPAAAHNDRQL